MNMLSYFQGPECDEWKVWKRDQGPGVMSGKYGNVIRARV